MAVRLELTDAANPGAPLVYEFDQARVTLGRASSSDVQLPDPSVSTTHCTLRAHQAGSAAVDEGSTNGTRVNGALIPSGRPKPLRSGDTLQVGVYTLRVEVGVAISSPTPAEQTVAVARKLALEVLVGRGEAVAPASLSVLNGPNEGARLPLDPAGEPVWLGRDPGCALCLSDADLSREHALVRAEADAFVLEDNGSKNGLRVNGRAVQRRKLRDRDEIELGRTTLVFDDPAAAALRALEQQPDEEAPPPPPPPAPPPEPEPEPAAWEGDVPAVVPAEPEPPAAAPTSRRRRSTDGRLADMMIYMLAGAVLALSAVGLYLLSRAG